MGKVEDATAAVPVMQRDIAETRTDVNEVRDDVRSLRRALYTTALSIVGSSVLFTFTVLQLIR
jgi:hypothetical protein